MLESSDSELNEILESYRISLEIITNMEYLLEKRKFLKGLYGLYRNDPYVINLAENCLRRGTAEDVEIINEITDLECEILYEIVSGNCERTKNFDPGSIDEAKYLFGKCKSGVTHSNYAEIADRVMDNYIK